MTIALDKDIVRRALSAHAATGLLASALLYLVCVSGTALVLYEEWQRIEQPHAPVVTTVAPEAVGAAATAMLARDAAAPRTTHLNIQLPTEALPRAFVATDTGSVAIDPAGRLAIPRANPWATFLFDLHASLHLPSTLGFIVVGMLGVAMAALTLSGILAHPRIFRDAFRLRARSAGGAGLADWHNRLGVWTLPFALALSLTGAILGLALPSAYGVAARFYGGDIAATYATIFGAEGKPDARPAPLADVATALHWLARHAPEARPTFVTIHDPQTAGQHIQIFAAHPRRLIYGESYTFDARGRFTAAAGMSDGATGKQTVASVYNLHFGNFGGVIVKLGYILIGAALCIVIGTGTSIWLDKRARRGLDAPRLRSGWTGLVWATPAMLAITFAARMLVGNAAPLTAIFWIGLALIVAAAIVHGRRHRVRRLLLGLLAASSAAGLILALTV